MITRTVRRYVIAASVLVLLVALYAVAGFWAVPHFLRTGLTDFVSTHYQRQLALGEIHFNPFTFKLDVSDFSLPDSDGQPMLAFGRLHVDLEIKSLFKLGPSFREILLERPLVRTVVRHDGTLNLADLGKGFASTPPATPPKSTQPMRLYIDRFAVIAGGGTFEDLSHATPFRAELKPIAFELHNFSSRARKDATGDNEYSLSAASPQGERLNWAGTILLEPLSSHGTFEIADLQAGTIWSYLQQPLPLEIPSGVIAVNGEYNFDTVGDAPAIKVDVHDTTVSDLKLRPRQRTTDYIVLRKLNVHETQVDLARRAVEVAKVSLTGGEVNAWVSPQGQLNLLELMGRGAKAGGEAGAPANATAPAWTVSVPDISVEGFKISAEDRQVSPALAVVLSPLDIHVAGYNSTPSSKLDVIARTSINGGATLNATAQLASSGAGDITAHVDLAKLDLSMFQPIIAQRTAMSLTSGQLATQLDIKKGADGNLSAKGDVAVTGLRTVDELQKSFIKWKDLRIAGLEYNLQPASLRLNSITAREPYARVIIAPDRTVNVEEVLAGPSKGTPSLATQLGAANAQKANGITPAATKEAGAAKEVAKQAEEEAKANPKAAQAAPSAPVMPISIGTVRIIDGSVNYADFWIQPNFAVGIQTLNGSIDGLSSDPASRAKVKLKGAVDRYAPVNIDGEMNLLAASVYSDIKMSFKGLELTTMTPYSGRFAGYKINKGKLSVDVNYKIDQRKLTAEQRFVIDQLQLGDPVDSPDAVHLPLKLAVALLKDRNGVIDVPLPISGSLDDPQFKVGPIIWHAVINLLAKVATAPFAALGRLFGGSHGEDMKYIDFAPGSAELDDGSKEKLASLSKALHEHTQLQLDVPIVFSKDLDGRALAKKRLNQRLVARARSDKSPKQQASRGTAVPVSMQAAASPPDGRSSVQPEPSGGNPEKRQWRDAGQTTVPTDVSDDPALKDPLQHYRLLLAEYEADVGKDAQLPPTAQAIQNAKNKKDAPPVETAIPELEDAIAPHIDVPDIVLQDLGKKRTRAIQDALLADGGIDASRVFIINGPPKTDDNGNVRVEMSLK
jgi:hypothetical protein